MGVPRRQIRFFPPAGMPVRVSAFFWIVAMVIGFGASQGILSLAGQPVLETWLGLSWPAVLGGEWWRLVTHGTLHAGVLHFLLTLAALILAGRELEPIIGRRHLLALLASGQALGVIGYGAASAWSSSPSGDALLGLSAGAAAVLGAWATILPEMGWRPRLLWIFPLDLRARHAALAAGALGATAIFTGTLSSTGPLGWLLGLLCGWGWARGLGFGNPLWWQRERLRRKEHAQRRKRMSAEEFISAEIDPILEKISREGMHRLTKAERRTLEEGREKIAQRTSLPQAKESFRR